MKNQCFDFAIETLAFCKEFFFGQLFEEFKQLKAKEKNEEDEKLKKESKEKSDKLK